MSYPRLLGALVLAAACADPVSMEDESDGGRDKDWRAVPFLFDGDLIPAEQTSYTCRGFSLDTPGPAHMVAFDPQIDGAEISPHHMVLYRLEHAPPSETWACTDMPAGSIPYFGWAPGTEALTLPETAGFLLGDDAPQTHFALQVHYENPGAPLGRRDGSGIVAWVSDDLRPSNAGVLTLGTVAGLEIPPGQTAYEYTNRCDTGAMPATLEVFGTFLHGHALLRQIWTDQFRDGMHTATVGRDDAFRADLQRYRPLEEQIVPGDSLITHCVFDSTARDEVTVGGEGAADEMCLNSLFYYPRIGTAWCGN